MLWIDAILSSHSDYPYAERSKGNEIQKIWKNGNAVIINKITNSVKNLPAFEAFKHSDWQVGI